MNNQKVVNSNGEVIGVLAVNNQGSNEKTKTAVKAFVGGIVIGALALTAYSLLTGKIEIYKIDDDSSEEE